MATHESPLTDWEKAAIAEATRKVIGHVSAQYPTVEGLVKMADIAKNTTTTEIIEQYLELRNKYSALEDKYSALKDKYSALGEKSKKLEEELQKLTGLE